MIPISFLACRNNCLAASNIKVAGLIPPRFHVQCWSRQPTSCLHSWDKLSPKHCLVDRINFSLDPTYCLMSCRLRPNAQQGSAPKPRCCSSYISTCQFDNWRNLYFVNIDQVLLPFSTYLEIAWVPTLHHLNATTLGLIFSATLLSVRHL